MKTIVEPVKVKFIPPGKEEDQEFGLVWNGIAMIKAEEVVGVEALSKLEGEGSPTGAIGAIYAMTYRQHGATFEEFCEWITLAEIIPLGEAVSEAFNRAARKKKSKRKRTKKAQEGEQETLLSGSVPSDASTGDSTGATSLN